MFEFEPKFLFISSLYNERDSYFFFCNFSGYTTAFYMSERSGTTVMGGGYNKINFRYITTWFYATNRDSGNWSGMQMNASSTTYYYFIIG